MKANISLMNYQDERKNLTGEILIGDEICLTLPDLNIALTGHDVDRNTNKKVVIKGGNHMMVLDWKSSYQLVGKWRSRGPWSTATITIDDLKKKSMKSWWDREDFSDLVEEAIVTMYGNTLFRGETPLLNWEKISPSDYSMLKRMGVYFSPYYKDSDALQKKLDETRVVDIHDQGVSCRLGKADEDFYCPPFTQMSLANFSVQDDEDTARYIEALRNSGITRLKDNSITSGSLSLRFLKKAKTTKLLRKSFKPFTGDILNSKKASKKIWYSLYEIGCRQDGVAYGYRRYVAINFQEDWIAPVFPVELLQHLVASNVMGETYTRNIDQLDPDGRHRLGTFVFNQVGHITSLLIDDFSKRQNLWNVDAKEENVRTQFGVNPEQIKSLFYAREEPKTPTGRRRPILHWIRSHQKRMREGTEVKTIPKKLRGVSEFVMDGTKFKITKPVRV